MTPVTRRPNATPGGRCRRDNPRLEDSRGRRTPHPVAGPARQALGSTDIAVGTDSRPPTTRAHRASAPQAARWAGLALLAAGALAAVGVAVALWAGPPPADSGQAVGRLQQQLGTLALALAGADDAQALSARQAIERQWPALAALEAPPAPLAAAEARWAAVRGALAQQDTTAALGALQALQPALDELAAAGQAQAAGQRRTRELALAAASMLAAATLLWAGLAMRRQRRTLRRLVHQVSADLGSGGWQAAVQSLRDERLGAPSAFDALASGVEGVLSESERRWQALADLAADWYWETDAQHRLAWTSGGGPLHDLRAQDLLGRRHDQIDAFQASADGWGRLHAAMDSGKPFRDMEFQVGPPGAGAAPVWVAISGRPRRDAAGRPAGYEGVGHDITERKRAHERLRASDQRWALMAGLGSDYYWETDTEHRLQPLRPEVARRMGPLAEHSEGRTPWDAFPDAMSPAQWQEYRDDVAARRPYRGVEMDIDLGGGRHRIVATSGIPRFDGSGRFLGYHGVGRDITMRREAQRLLLRHNEALQRAVAERTQDLEQINRDLEAFSRELAHELRTPIGHVQGLAHLLVTRAGDRLASDEMQLVGLQLQAARHMRETLDALLMLARSTAQPLALETVDVSAMAREVVEALPALPRVAGVQWHLAEGLQAQAAPAALRIVLTNLLANAAKFTRECSAPQVWLTGTPGPDGRLRIRVRDNGAGFDMAHAERLFKPFGRLHAGEQFQGTGIGLTIVQRIVERHGGTVQAHGEPRQGAWFEFTLEQGRPQAPTDAG